MIVGNGKEIYFTSANNFYNAVDAMELAKSLEIDLVKSDFGGCQWIKLMYKGKQLCPFSFHDIQHVHAFLHGVQASRLFNE